MEDRLGDAGGEREHTVLGLEQAGERLALVPAGCGEIDRREEGGSGGANVRVGADELLFRAGDIRAPGEQLRGYARGHSRCGDAREARGGDSERLRRLPNQDGQRVHLLTLLLLQRRDGRRDGRDDSVLLGNIERGRDAGLLIGLQTLQGLLGAGEIRAGDAHPIAQRERGEVGISDAGHDGELHGLTVITAGGRGGEQRRNGWRGSRPRNRAGSWHSVRRRTRCRAERPGCRC